MINKQQTKETAAKLLSQSRIRMAKSYDKTKTYAINHRQLSISIGIILLGIVITIIMVKFKRPPKRLRPDNVAPLVKIVQLKKENIQMVVSGFGTVQPKVQVQISPQISGKVVSINPQFKTGGFIAAEEELIQIDPRDYALAVRQAEALVAEAAVKLDMEKAEAEVAVAEWQQLHPGTQPSSALVLRTPQIRQAKAQLESAKAKLATAELNLERTRLSLPIDVIIISQKVDLGQYVMAGTIAGTAYGTDAVEIEVPLQDEDLAWFDIPDNNSAAETVSAEVKAKFAGKHHTWQGFVKRTTGQVNTSSRLISVVIEVKEPFSKTQNRPPLLPGIFVEVFIKGNILKDAVRLPRDAVRNRNEAWLFDKDRLHIKLLNIVRTDRDYLYTVDCLEDGDEIITSSLDAVTEGMSVRARKITESLNDE